MDGQQQQQQQQQAGHTGQGDLWSGTTNFLNAFNATPSGPLPAFADASFGAAAGIAGPSTRPVPFGSSPGPSPASASAGKTTAPDPIIAFLTEMPSAADNPTRVAIWTELVRFKTRSLELQIAEAKRKEREAELELARFKALTAAGPNRTSISSFNPTMPSTTASNQPAYTGYTQPSGLSTSLPTSATPLYPYYHTAGSQAPSLSSTLQATLPSQSNTQQMLQQTFSTQTTGLPQGTGLTPDLFNIPQSVTPFDLQAINENFDDMFNWLPDFDNDGNLANAVGTGQGGIAPSALQLPSTTFVTSPITRKDSDLVPPDDSTPARRRGSSEAGSVEEEQPTAKKPRRATGKRTVIELLPTCSQCKKSLGKVLIRAPQLEMPDSTSASFKCLECAPVETPVAIGDAGLGGTAIGTVETRKRQRMAMEAEDEEAKIKERRQFCDVCQRVIGSGQVKGGKENIGYMAEVICASCDSKYQRCTDCGGGGGPRQGIGKWRLKQVFHPGRKTCSLSHSRLGDRQREIGVHVTPSDFTPEQFKEVITRCKALWQEKNLSRLAVPEMLEIELPANLVNPLQSYADIENQITGNWPSREAMIRAEGADPARFKRILGLTWAHAKPRRGVRTVDLEEEYHKVEADDEEDNSTVLDNIKKTNVAIPAGCELIGMWGGEWDIQQGSILVSTFIPFEGTDGEDSTALSVGEIITKVQTLQQSMSVERQSAAKKAGIKTEPIPQVEHLWVVSGGSVPLVRERMADILIRKRSFVHVEEYLTRHPSFANALAARPYGLHPSDTGLPTESGEFLGKPLILVRWLGKDFDAQKIHEIKQMEFGGKTKPKRRTKSKV